MKKTESSNSYHKIYWFPVIEASLAVEQQPPDRAVVALEPALPDEYGGIPPAPLGAPIYPTYLRGVAYLNQKNGTFAAGEFQKFLDHRGIVLNFPLGSLACLLRQPSSGGRCRRGLTFAVYWTRYTVREYPIGIVINVVNP